MTYADVVVLMGVENSPLQLLNFVPNSYFPNA